MMLTSPYSIYIHIPFCSHRCGYCDFNTYAGKENLIPSYISAICKEIFLVSNSIGYKLPVHTIFFGGGTPSLLSVDELQKILCVLDDCVDIQTDSEITLEANPGTVSAEFLRDLRKLGVNRLSLGMQSAHENELKLLQRQHHLKDVKDAVEWARKAGFENLNLDLIYGLPFQTPENWLHTLKTALEMGPDHLSLYALTIEPGTPLYRSVQKGFLPSPDDDLAADMYEIGIDHLELAGFYQYEISNFARRSSKGCLMVCEHNLQYWHNLPYLGFGAGAHGFAAHHRLSNVLRIPTYIQRIEKSEDTIFPFSPATAQFIRIDQDTEMQETMLVGLRLTREGISNTSFLERFGKSLESVFGREIKTLIEKGLLEWADDRHDTIRLTQKGRLLGNQVFMQFVGSA